MTHYVSGKESNLPSLKLNEIRQKWELFQKKLVQFFLLFQIFIRSNNGDTAW